MRPTPSIRLTVLTLTLLLLAAVGPSVFAEDTLLINYQGYLTDGAGDAITGSPLMTFTIYTAGGTSKWSESHLAVTVTDGVFSVNLGSQTALADSVFDGEYRYLGISVDRGDELTPRTLLTSSPGAAYARQLVGDIATGQSKLVLINPEGDSGIVLNSNATETGLTIKGTSDLGYPGLIAFGMTAENVSGIFGPADPFTMGGNLEITSDPDQGGLLVTHGYRDDSPDIELRSNIGANLLRLHPPDPCVPPEPCQPALEMLANVDTHVMRLYPPDPCVPPDPCDPALELIADAELHGIKIFPPDPCASPPCAPAAIIAAGPSEVDFDVLISLPSDDIVTPISMGTSVGSQASHLIIASPTIDGKPNVEITSMPSVATIMVQGPDQAGDSPQIALIAGADGASVCIGTDTPNEALTVMGNGWFSGEVFTLTLTKAKRNIEPIDGALDKVSQMNGYYYDCRTDEYPDLRLPENRQIGFLAEEVNEVVPEAVSENDSGWTGVSYSRITALLVEAVKELKSENEELRSRIEALESR